MDVNDAVMVLASCDLAFSRKRVVHQEKSTIDLMQHTLLHIISCSCRALIWILLIAIAIGSTCLTCDASTIRIDATNLTTQVSDSLAASQYEMALGCPAKAQEFQLIDGGRTYLWLPCRTAAYPQDCNAIQSVIIAHYEGLLKDGQCEIGYAIGTVYNELQAQGKLKCTIEGASMWRSANLMRLHQLAAAYGHNIHLLTAEKSKTYSIIAAGMKYVIDEIIDTVGNPSDKQQLKKTLQAAIRGRKLNPIVSNDAYQMSITLHMEGESAWEVANAFEKGLIVSTVIMNNIDDKTTINYPEQRN